MIPEDDIANLYKGLVFAIREYVHKQGFKGVIVPVSGGIDSALVAALSVDALGPDKVKLFICLHDSIAQNLLKMPIRWPLTLGAHFR